jgi:hypothetical protein
MGDSSCKLTKEKRQNNVCIKNNSINIRKVWQWYLNKWIESIESEKTFRQNKSISRLRIIK